MSVMIFVVNSLCVCKLFFSNKLDLLEASSSTVKPYNHQLSRGGALATKISVSKSISFCSNPPHTNKYYEQLVRHLVDTSPEVQYGSSLGSLVDVLLTTREEPLGGDNPPSPLEIFSYKVLRIAAVFPNLFNQLPRRV